MTAWCSGRAAGRLAPARAMPAAAAAPQPPPPLPPPPPPRISRRLAETDVPCVAATRALVAAVPGTLSLAQGVVHWPPPAAALAAAAACAADAAVSLYGPDEGLPALRAALRAKLAARNSLPGYDAIVTAGANQGFASAVLALVDAGDAVALFAPYYFNHLMALQMTGGGARVLLGPCDPATLRPNLEWLAAALADPAPAARPRLVVLTNPCNPTGVLLTAAEVRRAAALCAAAGAWLLLDNTYEDFCFDGRQHACAAGPHILHLFSFSKAYGMAGWRVGYLAYPAADAELAGALLAAQDTVPVCAAQLSQRVALTALTAGGEGEGGGAAGGEAWVAARVAGLAPNRAAARAALAPLGAGVSGGEGAIYYFARLPEGCADDGAVVEWLVRRHRVCVIPGGACGAPGHVRVAFANLEPGACARACARLRHGLEELAAAGGMGRVRAFLALGEAAQAAERAALAAEEEAQELAAAA